MFSCGKNAYLLLIVCFNSLMQVRDPNAQFSWTGKWCPTSSAWDDVNESELPTSERGSATPGMFWMCASDYAK